MDRALHVSAARHTYLEYGIVLQPNLSRKVWNEYMLQLVACAQDEVSQQVPMQLCSYGWPALHCLARC